MRALASLFVIFACQAQATISIAHQNTAADVSGSGTKNYTVASTSVGNLMAFAFNFRSNATDTITSVTDTGSDSCVTAGQRSTSAADARAIEIWYCPSLSASVTTFTIAATGSGTISVMGYEYASSLAGHMFLDTGSHTVNQVTNGSSAAIGTSFTTGAATNDGLFAFCAGASITTFTAIAPLVNASQDGHGNQLADALNQSASTYTPSFTTDAAAAAFNLSAVAFRDTAPATGGAVMHRVTIQ